MIAEIAIRELGPLPHHSISTQKRQSWGGEHQE